MSYEKYGNHINYKKEGRRLENQVDLIEIWQRHERIGIKRESSLCAKKTVAFSSYVAQRFEQNQYGTIF